MGKKEEALAAIQAANPKWSQKHVEFAHLLMPTAVSYAFEEGTREAAQAAAHHRHLWTKWAIEMNLIPEDTPVPEDPGWPGGAAPRRATQTAPVASGAPRPPPMDPMPKQEGIQAPREGTVGKKIWDCCDEVYQRLGTIPMNADPVVELATARGLNPGNARTEFSRWKKFHTPS